MSSTPRTMPIELTSFVGRADETAQVVELVGASRLVTLTGAGGAGKTRLAMRAGVELDRRFRSGVVFVDLAPLTDPTLIAQAVVQALGAGDGTSGRADEALDAAAADIEALIVLDNCEHLVDAAGELVAHLLGVAPQVRVLATSREPLCVDGETVMTVLPLRVPSADARCGATRLSDFDGTRLFVERAAAANAGVVFDDAAAESVAAICRQLDGMPLAIELAAARVRTMSPQEILARLGDRFGLLKRSRRAAVPRHETLRAAVEWSHDLLTEPERVLFRRLAVFVGGWDLAAAEAVCSAPPLEPGSVLDELTHLVDRSLIVTDRTTEGTTRFRFLETLRHYATERLEETEEGPTLRARHLQWFGALAESYHRDRNRGGSDVGLAQLAANRDNFRHALNWAADHDPEAALALTGALDDFWRMVSAAEGWAWLQRTLAEAPAESPHRPRALVAAGMLAAYIPAYAEGAGLLGEAIEVARQHDDRMTEAWADLWLGRLAFFAGDTTRAEAHLQRALEAHEALNSRLGLVRALCLLGLLEALIVGRPSEGVARLELARALSAEIADTWGEGYAHMMLALAAADRADPADTTTHALAALDATVLGPLLAVPLLALAVATVDRDPGRAARLLGASAGHLARTSTTPPPFLVQRMHTTRARADELIGTAAAERAWAEGRAMTSGEAFELARADHDDASRTENQLTRREAEVATLVARGLTNREISEVLHVSVRTVESHIDHALTKLGRRNRTELATWATENLTETAPPRNR